MKKIVFNFIFLCSIIFNISFAGCGGCQITNDVKKNEPSSAFINSLPYYGTEIDGLVIASCNKCNFGKYTDRKCSLGIQIGTTVYPVENFNHNHSKAHNHDGICNALRVAYVKGDIKMGKLVPEKIELINIPQ